MILNVLIDTGSDRNIWVGSKFKLLKLRSKYLGRLKGKICGFTDSGCCGDVYKTYFDIDNFHWDNVLFIYPDDINVNDNFDMILGSTMFQCFSIEVDYNSHIVRIINKVKKQSYNDSIYEYEMNLKSKGKSMFVNIIDEQEPERKDLNFDMIDLNEVFGEDLID